VRLARELEDKLAQARSDVLHLDAVIRMFDPASEPEAILPKEPGRRLNWFVEGKLPRKVLDVLRTATEPLSAREIATEVMQRRGFNPEDAATLATVEKRVNDILRRRRDVLEKVQLGPRAVGWKVKE
jgi:hypothetical protein